MKSFLQIFAQSRVGFFQRAAKQTKNSAARLCPKRFNQHNSLSEFLLEPHLWTGEVLAIQKLARSRSESVIPSSVASAVATATSSQLPQTLDFQMLHCPTLSRLGHRPIGTGRGSNKPLPLYRQGCYQASLRRHRTAISEYSQGGTPMHQDKSNLLDPSTELSVDALKAGAPSTITQFFFLLLSSSVP